MKKEIYFVLSLFAVCSCYYHIDKNTTASTTTYHEETTTQPPQATKDTRCYLNDSACQINFFQTVAKDYAETGVPQLDIQIIDPYRLKDIVLSILGLLFLKLVKGEALGISNCIVTNYETNLTEWYRQPEMICPKIIIRGHYKVIAAPIMGNICGWCNINGEGNGTIVLEDWYFKFRYNFLFEKRADKQIYLKALFDEAMYETSVGKVTVEADSIKNGKYDITQKVIRFINCYYKTIMNSSVGKFIYGKAAEYYFYIYDLYYTRLPANNFMKDNLTALIEAQTKKYC